MDIVDVPQIPGATPMQKLQRTMIGFFNSDRMIPEVEPTFKLNTHLDVPDDFMVWVEDDDVDLAKLELAFPKIPIHNLKFSTGTSSELSSGGAKRLIVVVEVYARGARGVVSANGEMLSLRLTLSWVPDPALPLPDWKETLLPIRAALSQTLGQDFGVQTFDHPTLGTMKLIKRKGFRTLGHDSGVSM